MSEQHATAKTLGTRRRMMSTTFHAFLQVPYLALHPGSFPEQRAEAILDRQIGIGCLMV